MAQSGDRPLADLRILVVEDEFFIADELVRALSAAGAIAVGPASTIDEAEAYLLDGEIDGAILDMNLRGVIAGHLAEQALKMQLPCLVVSGYDEASLPETALNLPRLQKPVASCKVVHALIQQIETKAG